MKWNRIVKELMNKNGAHAWPRNRSIIRRSALMCMLLAAVLNHSAIYALSTDSQQPIEIEADFAELDDQEGRTIYVGNVIVTQGSIRMKGDKLKVLFDADRDLEHVHMEGRPAYFKQTPDGGKEDVEGEGLIIEYFAKKGMLHLIQKAKLTQGARLFTGDRINYDARKSVITGRGEPKNKATQAKDDKPKKRERIKVIIPPKKSAP
ncbi:MAG: lipopolysaccharide transport periplasmic protein LptA [Pseudomonadota bacterium]